MRIADLSRRSGLPVATIKFYIREGLVPPGAATMRNQAVYSEAHLRRLLVVRVLTGFGGLSVSSVRDLLVAIDEQALPASKAGRAANLAMFRDRHSCAEFAPVPPAWIQVDELLSALGWGVAEDSPARATLATALAALQYLTGDYDTSDLLPYAAAAARLEAHRACRDGADPATQIAAEALVSAAFAALCELARERQPSAPCR